jgi:hypothetical protein
MMSETEILNKLVSIENGQRRNGALTRASFGFAVAIFAATNIASTDPLAKKILAVIICVAGLYWFLQNILKWRQLSQEDS